MSKKVFASSMAMIAVAAGLAACTQSLPNAQGPNPQVAAGTVSFKTDVAPILAATCNGCHTPGGLGSSDCLIFDASGAVSYGSVQRAAGNIVRNVRNGKMPQGGSPLTADQIAKLQSWQSAGAPNN